MLLAAARTAAGQSPPSDVTTAEARSDDELGLTVFSASYLGSASTASVLVGIEVHGVSDAPLAQDGLPRRLEVRYLTDGGRPAATEHAVAVPLGDSQTVKQAAREGVRVLTRVGLTPGPHVLRVTARDTGDRRTGSVVHALEVPNLVEAPVTMSSLVLSSSGVGGVTHTDADDDRTLPLVARPPTGRRLFSRGEQVEVNAEIYEAVPDDLMGQLTVATSIVSSIGRAVYETVDVGQSETLTSGAYGYHHYTLVPVGTLQPGAYVVRVTASVDGAMTASRSVSIAVAGSDESTGGGAR